MTIEIGTWVFPLFISGGWLAYWYLNLDIDPWGLGFWMFGVTGSLLTWLGWALMKVWGWF